MDWPHYIAAALWGIVIFLLVKYEFVGLCQWDKWFHPERLRVECAEATNV